MHSAVDRLWLAGLTLQFLLNGTLVGKKVWGKFPLFFAYSAFNLLESVVMYPLISDSLVYFYAYVFGETIAVLLGLAVFYEIFRWIFSLYPNLRRAVTMSFYIVLTFLLLLAVGVLSSHATKGESGLLRAVLTMEEAARILEVGLIAFLFVFHNVFALHWRRSVFGITLGLGICTVAKLLSLAVIPNADPGREIVNLVYMAASNGGILVWLIYFLMPERVITADELPPRTQLEQWNQAMMELIHQ